MGHRMSSLPITQYCGMAGHLSASGASGRAAATSTVFHAKAAEDPDYFRLYTLLAEKERQEVDEMQLPQPQEVDGHTLVWSEGCREMEVAINKDGVYVDASSPEAISIGHMDNAWHEGDTAYVADIKRSIWTVTERINSLQLKAYGIAYATKVGARYMKLAIYAATEGEWIWGERIDLESPAGWEIFAQVVHAAQNGADVNQAEYATGDHCSGCWDRLRCKQWLIPFSDPLARLNMFIDPDGLNGDNVVEALEYISGAEKLLKHAKSTAQAYAKRNSVKRDGKEYVQCWGSQRRMVLDHAALEREHPELIQRYQKDAGPRNMGMRWKKAQQ